MNPVENEGKTAIAKTKYLTDQGEIFAKMQAAMANPIQQGLKPTPHLAAIDAAIEAAMANPIQQGLKPSKDWLAAHGSRLAAMANPIQQGLKHLICHIATGKPWGRNG